MISIKVLIHDHVYQFLTFFFGNLNHDLMYFRNQCKFLNVTRYH